MARLQTAPNRCVRFTFSEENAEESLKSTGLEVETAGLYPLCRVRGSKLNKSSCEDLILSLPLPIFTKPQSNVPKSPDWLSAVIQVHGWGGHFINRVSKRPKIPFLIHWCWKIHQADYRRSLISRSMIVIISARPSQAGLGGFQASEVLVKLDKNVWKKNRELFNGH